MLNDERPMLQELLYIIKRNPDSTFLENVLTYAQNLERASAQKQL